MKKLKLMLIGMGVLSLILSGCAGQDPAQGGLQASGTISADLVSIAPEMNEKVLAVNVREGQVVSQGDVLFTQDDAMLQAQYEQVKAQLAAAGAALEAAQAQLTTALAQQEVLLQGLRLQDSRLYTTTWQTEPQESPVFPGWYFQKTEDLSAAQAEEAAAEAALELERANLIQVLQAAGSGDFVAAEKRLAQAIKAYQAWDAVLEQARAAGAEEAMEESAQDQLDSATAELNAAQVEYDRMLTSTTAEEVLTARARLAVSQARLQFARTETARLQTGDDSLQAQASQAQVQQAETAVTQARANQTQAEAALRLIELQIGRAEVKAPVGGTILARNIEPGELAAAGSLAITIGKLDQVRLIVYIPEDQYGSIRLNEPVIVNVDSYPGRSFEGLVVAIADQAEFTPRNVATVEGRKSTVYAVEILLPNPDQALKPGMPAQVIFEDGL